MSVGCKDLQLGTNEIQVGIYEKSQWLSNVYDITKNSILTEFRFFDDAILDPSIYSIMFEVSSECRHEPIINEDMDDLPGYLQYKNIDYDTINKKIDEEDFNPDGGILIGNGEIVRNWQSDS